MSFVQLKELLGKAAGKWGMQRSVTASIVCNRYRELAPGIVHPQVLSYSRPRYFKNGILEVYAANSAWAHTLSLHSHDLVAAINTSLPESVLSSIKITLAG